MPAALPNITPAILIVDDEADVRESISNLVLHEFPDAIVHTASSADEALEILDREALDLVISDYQMKGMNGIDLIRTMRKRAEGLPCLLVTGHADLGLVLEAKEDARAETVVPKPPDPRRFTQSIRSALARPRIPTASLFRPLVGFQE